MRIGESVHNETVLSCPGCSSPNDGLSSAQNSSPPSEGSLAVCAYCFDLGIIVGTPPTSIRKPTDAELIEIMADPHVRHVMRELQKHGPFER